MNRYVLFLVVLATALTAMALACGIDARGSQPTSTPGGSPTTTPSTTAPTVTPTATREEQAAQSRLDSARARWELHKPESYEFDFQWMCFCGPDYTRLVRIRVRAGEIVSITDPETGKDVTPPQADSFKTVDGLFDWMAEKIADGVYSENVEYDRVFSYPAQFDDDPKAHAVDAGKSFTISNFRSITEHPKQAEARGQLDQARARWESLGPDSYEFDFEWICYCVLITDTVRIRVENGEIANITDPETARVVALGQFDDFRTIDGLFDWIEGEIDRPVDELEVEYDDQLGHPLSAEADRIVNGIDDEQSFHITNFRPVTVIGLDAARERLNEARNRWGAHDFDSYEFDFRWTCWCFFASSDPVRIRVENGAIVSVTHPFTGEPVPEPEYDVNRYMTIDELLDWVRHQIEIPADKLTVEYDGQFGYPVNADSDPSITVDDERSFQISDFRPVLFDLDAARERLNEARAKWVAAGYEDYTFHFRWECFWCRPEIRKPAKVKVRGGAVASVTDVETGEPREEIIGDQGYRTVDELFAWIESELQKMPDFAELEFDPETGFPMRAEFDYTTRYYDDEIAFFATDLERLDGHPGP
jgi:hypothetical protein